MPRLFSSSSPPPPRGPSPPIAAPSPPPATSVVSPSPPTTSSKKGKRKFKLWYCWLLKRQVSRHAAPPPRPSPQRVFSRILWDDFAWKTATTSLPSSRISCCKTTSYFFPYPPLIDTCRPPSIQSIHPSRYIPGPEYSFGQ